MRTHQRHLSHKQELLSPSLQFTSHFDLNWWFSWEVYTSVVPAESTCASGYKISHASGNTDKHNAMLLAVLNGIEIQPSSWKGYTNGWRKFAWLQHYYIYLMIIIFQTLVQSVRLVMVLYIIVCGSVKRVCNSGSKYRVSFMSLSLKPKICSFIYALMISD